MLNKVIKIIKEAGKKLMFFFYNKNNNINIKYKFDNSPYTNIDYKINDFIIRQLYLITPNIPILSEEFLPKINICKNWDKYWLIDPLDGTKEFLKGIPEFTINICLIKNKKPVLGLIYVPFYKILYYSYLGVSWKEYNSCKKKIFIKFIDLNKNCNIAVSRFHNNNINNFYINKFISNSIIKIGSSWKFGLLAEGKIQYYPRFGNTGIWDTAAGEVIINSAGAKIKTFNGKKLDYSLNKSFINPGFQVYI